MEDKKELININDSTKEVVTDIVNTNDPEEFKDLVSLFNLNQSKKNALRIVKLNELLDKIENTAIDRFNKKPDQMSNQDLLDYLKAIENSIDRSQKYVNEVETKPMIQLNQQNNININAGDNLSRESKEKVLEVIKSLLSGEEQNIEDQNIIIESTDEGEEDDNN